MKTYELYPKLNPFNEKDLLKAHGVMMNSLTDDAGRFRHGGVGVFAGQKCIHLALPATRVPFLIGDLFDWLKHSKDHLLIRSCVFHYEFEFIHPFSDGNGRMGRMWQTLLLMQWKPIFAWLPVETIVKENQQKYYDAIALSDKQGNSTAFITFMLKCILASLKEMCESNQKSNQKVLSAISENPDITIKELQTLIGLSESGIKKILRQLRNDGVIVRIGGAKGGHWEILK